MSCIRFSPGKLALLSILVCTCFKAVWAQENGSMFLLHRSFEAVGTPKEAFFFVEVGEKGLTRFAAELVPPLDAEGKTIASLWKIGILIPIPRDKDSLTSSVVVVYDDGEFQFLGPQSQTIRPFKSLQEETVSQKVALDERREIRKSLQVQFEMQGNELDRLRADAEIISLGQRIGEFRMRIRHAEREIHAVKRDNKNLSRVLTLTKSAPEPKHYSRRVAMLTKHLKELADAAKRAESSEFERRTRSQISLRQQLQLIQDARGVNKDALSKRLIALRNRRQQLEGELGVSAESIFQVDDYVSP